MSGIEELRRELVADASARTPTLAALERRVRARRRHRVAGGAMAGVIAVAVGAVIVAAGHGSEPETEVVLGAGDVVTPLDEDWLAQFGDGVDVIVYLDPEAPASSVDAVATVLEDHPAVGSFEYLDEQAAYEEFRRLFIDENPELVESVTPEVLPTSFKVDVAEPVCASARELREALDGADDVREVIVPFC